MDASRADIPLLEYDADRSALIDPAATQPSAKAPVAGVACFFPEIIDSLTRQASPILELPSRTNLWEIQYGERRLALFYPGLGAPLAGYSLERVIAAGCRVIVACGGAGALRPDLTMGHHIITVTSAIRDEGTSFHYVPPAREIQVDPLIVEILSAVVENASIPHLLGRTWTTDGIFRETPARVAKRSQEGCLTVEMEAAALISIAKFRGVHFGQYLYAGDDLSSGIWAYRDWREASAVRELIMDLAARSAFSIVDRLGLL